MEKAFSPANSAVIRTGRWWFQRRGVSPVPVVILCAILPVSFALEGVQLALVVAGILVAEAGRIWAVGYAGSATRTRGDTVPKLVHAGPFRHVRNPLYIANIAIYTLAGLAFGFDVFGLLIAAYFIVQYSFIVAFEEDLLRREFGVAYEFYSARVSRWLPSFSPRVESSGHRFEFAKALRSERATFVALAIMALIFVGKRALS
jgi:protein-S-isoprenylcysteine O-methyltransferase Ste14